MLKDTKMDTKLLTDQKVCTRKCTILNILTLTRNQKYVKRTQRDDQNKAHISHNFNVSFMHASSISSVLNIPAHPM